MAKGHTPNTPQQPGNSVTKFMSIPGMKKYGVKSVAAARALAGQGAARVANDGLGPTPGVDEMAQRMSRDMPRYITKKQPPGPRVKASGT